MIKLLRLAPTLVEANHPLFGHFITIRRPDSVGHNCHHLPLIIPHGSRPVANLALPPLPFFGDGYLLPYLPMYVSSPTRTLAHVRSPVTMSVTHPTHLTQHRQLTRTELTQPDLVDSPS